MTQDCHSATDKNLENEKPVLRCTGKPKVCFLCVHNSCRSQIAEALGKKLASDVFDSYSAGTQWQENINPDAVRMMKKLHGINMEETQYSKLLSDIPQPDIVIFMGCNVSCPRVSYQYAENWGLDDPSGQNDEVFTETIKKIEKHVLALKNKLR
ncbi:arsenate reductase/protein-tyrosine-phosphatase family protein [Candidatus Agathobaculum pullicola]|uniref:arsenate reductase/protein-tyrosine-phosphatase family protein n=1 Tax=Candidatus Agathobaculum pullicola TaxID=2838426 RepID=UPI003F8EECEC